MWTGRSFADLLGRQIRFRFEQSPLIYFYHLPSLSRSFFVKTLYTDFSSALLGRRALEKRNGADRQEARERPTIRKGADLVEALPLCRIAVLLSGQLPSRLEDSGSLNAVLTRFGSGGAPWVLVDAGHDNRVVPGHSYGDPDLASSGFHRSPSFFTRAGTLATVKSSIATPFSTSFQVTGV